MELPHSLPPLPDQVSIREVGPRDGLQAEAPLPPADRAQLVAALVRAGVRWVEVGSFVSPKAVPAMAGAAETFAAVDSLPERPDLRVVALVPNLKGAERALDAHVDEISVTVAASPTYNERNVHMSVPESVAVIADICRLAGERGVPVDAVVSCAFGSPYEGDTGAGAVADLVARLQDAGTSSFTLADTTGMATPRASSPRCSQPPERTAACTFTRPAAPGS